MQEAELKRREERRFKKGREREEEEQSKEKKQEAVLVERPGVREPEKIAKKQIIFKLPLLQPKEFKEIKMHEGGFNREIPKIIVFKIPFLRPKEIKETKTKIKAFLTEIPELEPIKREIPKISTKTKSFKGISRRKFFAFNVSIPTMEWKIINLAVPHFTTKPFHGLKTRNIHFNLELPEISNPERPVFMPRIGVKPFSRIKAKEKALNSNIPQGLSSVIPSTEVIERGKEEVKGITKIQEETAAEVSEEEIGKELELPNFSEFLLGKGAGKISEGKPICIIVEETKEKYEELIAILCRDIFREKIGGKPTPIYRETIEELRHEFESLVERKIIVVKVEKSSKDLIQILKGFFSQDMGFLILVSSEPLKLEDEIRKRGELFANIITVSPPPEIEWEGIRDELLKIIRGTESFIQAQSFGEEFKKSVDTLDDELVKKYLNYKKAPSELKENWDRLTKCSPDDYAQASDVHSAMKAFVWMHEWKKSGKRKNPELETENRGVDVKIEDRNYEMETLFGVGDIMSKLTEKIKKYEKGEKVYFVLRNLDLSRNLPLFLSFKRDWEKAGYKVEFFGLDLDKEELVPLEEFVKQGYCCPYLFNISEKHLTLLTLLFDLFIFIHT